MNRKSFSSISTGVADQMSWTPLAERFSSLPLILAGPMLRRTEPQAVTVWLALKEARIVTLCIYGRDAGGKLVQQFEGTRHTVRLGDHLHIVAVTARATTEHERLAWGQLYYYNLFFQSDGTSASNGPATLADLYMPDVLLIDPSSADLLHRLVYPGHPLPSFVLPAEDLNQVKLLHGSCRKPHGVGKEMLSVIDAILEGAINIPADRPQQLFMTGDQIYGDDVAASLLFALIDAGKFLLEGNKEEVLPLVQMPARMLAPGKRTEVVRNKVMFTTTTPQNQLLSFAEYATMYLFAWSDVLWPDEPPTPEEIWNAYPEARPQPAIQAKTEATSIDHMDRLSLFRSTLPQVRRALANIATYMICDDHDVTDDWFLDGAWCRRVLASTLGRRVVRNALLAYALFQAWGNTPDQFEEPNGLALLNALDTWRGEQSDSKEKTIAELIGLPDSFEGSGELPHSDQALKWNYTFTGPRYQLIVMDTRMHRIYRTPNAFPGLLAPGAIEKQIVAAQRKDAEVTIIISAAPVLGVGLIEAIQFWSRLRIKDNYAYDRETWNLEWGTFQKFLSTVSTMKRVVFLAGDVHYAFAASLEYWDLARSTTAKIINFTSSPLRNEGPNAKMAMLAVGYPYLSHLLRHTQMPTVDFFAWDIAAVNRHILKKIITIIQSRIMLFWWAVPRLIDARRSPSEIVLPARGWPKGAFSDMPPDRSYRLYYLRDTLHPADAQDVTIEQGPTSHLSLTRLKFKLKRMTLRVIIFAEARLGRARRKLARRSLAAEQAPEVLPKGTHHIVRGSIKGAEVVEHRLEKRKDRLAEDLFHREEWLSKWKAGAYIVGYANIGEIGFDWTPEEKSAFQRLWWWHPDTPDHPTLGTEYRDTLELPQSDAAPPLPVLAT
jgi:hypothetical protein